MRKQVEAGIDVVADGDEGKASFFGYIVERFTSEGNMNGAAAVARPV